MAEIIKQCCEFIDRKDRDKLPSKVRGIYALYKERPRLKKFDQVYIGIATRGGIKGRLNQHAKSRRKGDRWTHFSAYEVHEDVPDDLVAELEGLFLHIFRKDRRAQRLNKQRRHRPIRKVRKTLEEWEG